MAITVAQVEAEIAAIRESIRIVQRDIDDIARERAEINAKIQALTSSGTPLTEAQRTEYAELRAKRGTLGNEELTARGQLVEYQSKLDGLALDLRNARAVEAAQSQPTVPPPPTTAAQTVQDDAPAGPSAPPPQTVTAQGRITAEPPQAAPSNAVPPVTSQTVSGTDFGTNAPVRTLEQTQAPPVATATTVTPSTDRAGNNVGIELRDETGAVSQLRRNPETGELYNAAGLPPSAAVGVGANDDAGGEDTGGTNTTVYEIMPRPNKLDRFYSYTYQASVYMLTQEQYTSLLRSKNKTVDGYFLLFQSGGAPLNQGGVRPPPAPTPVTSNLRPAAVGANAEGNAGEAEAQAAAGTGPAIPQTFPDGGRNPFFDHDFYIDSITLDNQLLGKGSGNAHLAASLKFTVIEPNGITLIDRLYKAAQNLQQKTAGGKVNYTATEYLMVIRWYGYDDNGNLIAPLRSNVDGGGTSDTGAVIEKFVPFRIEAINWSVGSRVVSYEWNCVPVGQMIGGFTGRGTVPYDIQLNDSTVEGLLGSKVQYATATPPATNPGQPTTAAGKKPAASTAAAAPATPPAPPPAAAAPGPKRIAQGLMGALNEFEQDLVKRGIYKVADQYEIKFIDGTGPDEKIGSAKLALKTPKRDLKQTAAGAPAAGSNGNAQNLKPESNPVDNVSRSFSITAGQSIVQAIEMTIRNSTYITDQSLVILQPDGTYLPNPAKRDKPMKWFAISFTATPLGYDDKRNDNAYRITFTVKPYTVRNFASKYFPVSKFQGIHKKYPYWFTGQNTAVLEYQETLNALYTITVSGTDAKTSAAQEIAKNFTSSMRDIVKYQYYARSGENSAGAKGKELENNANAAEVIYSPSDLGTTKIKILGDPDWIQQGSLFKEYSPGEYAVEAQTGFNPDGSIAFDAGDPMFEIVWQRPEDYDLGTGIADPYSGGYSGQANASREALQSRVYIATKVVSEFHQGKFTQQIEGSLYQYPTPEGTNAANAAAARAATTANNDAGKPAAGTPARSAPASSSDRARNTAAGAAGGGRGFINPPLAGAAQSDAQAQSGAQQPPVAPARTLPILTQEEIENSPAYKAARARGLNRVAAAQAAREAAAANQGSGVTSNGQAVGTQASPAAGRLPPAAGPSGLTDQQRRNQAAGQNTGAPGGTNPVTQDQAKES
jgi:hypothetical protein